MNQMQTLAANFGRLLYLHGRSMLKIGIFLLQKIKAINRCFLKITELKSVRDIIGRYLLLNGLELVDLTARLFLMTLCWVHQCLKTRIRDGRSFVWGEFCTVGIMTLLAPLEGRGLEHYMGFKGCTRRTMYKCRITWS